MWTTESQSEPRIQGVDPKPQKEQRGLLTAGTYNSRPALIIWDPVIELVLLIQDLGTDLGSSKTAWFLRKKNKQEQPNNKTNIF